MANEVGQGWAGSPVEHVAAPMESWTAMLLQSGILFWLGGLLAWVPHTKTWQQGGWLGVWESFVHKLEPVQTVLMIFGLMLVAAAVASVIKRLELPVLRFLEGYHLPRWLRKRWVSQQQSLFEKQSQRFQALMQKYPYLETEQDWPDLHAEELAELVRLDEELMLTMPSKREHQMPTRLGNLLRTMEMRPLEKYGLDAYICWPRLWLLLPEEVKADLTTARYQLDATVRAWLWGGLFLIWSYWAWCWVIPVSLVTMLLAYRWMLQAAKVYGHLIESSFDVYRHLLYQSLRWPLPNNPAEELQEGKRLTKYLWRGPTLDQKTPEFTRVEVNP